MKSPRISTTEKTLLAPLNNVIYYTCFILLSKVVCQFLQVIKVKIAKYFLFLLFCNFLFSVEKKPAKRRWIFSDISSIM